MAEKISPHPKVIEAAGGLLWRIMKNSDIELAIVHRPRYDDWTLPKGHRKTNESWRETAIREVFEETGYKTRLGLFAGSSAYMVNHTPKVVLFWHMGIIEDMGFIANDEVDQLIWLPPEDARMKISYKNEQTLIPKNPYEIKITIHFMD